MVIVMVKFGEPKVLLLSLDVPEIPQGEIKMIEWKGQKLSESRIANSLPALGVIITNNSSQDIRLIFNEALETSFIIVGGASQGMTGYPVIDIEIQNLGNAAVQQGEINLNIMNDTIECLRFKQAKAAGVVPYV